MGGLWSHGVVARARAPLANASRTPSARSRSFAFALVCLALMVVLPAAHAAVVAIGPKEPSPIGPAVAVGKDIYSIRPTGKASSVVDHIVTGPNATLVTLNVNLPFDAYGTTAAVDGSVIYLFGGRVNGVSTHDIWALDLLTEGLVLQTARADFGLGAAAFTYGGQIYLVGGTECSASCPVARFDPGLDTITNLAYGLGRVPPWGSIADRTDGIAYFVAPGGLGGVWQIDTNGGTATLIAAPDVFAAGAAAWWAGCGIAVAGGATPSSGQTSTFPPLQMLRLDPPSVTNPNIVIPDSDRLVAVQTTGSLGAKTYLVGAGLTREFILDLNGADVCWTETNEARARNTTQKDPVVVDADRDGIRDESDDCPDVGDVDQADMDADGIGDACDPTPCTPDRAYGNANATAKRACDAKAAAQAAPSGVPKSSMPDVDQDGVADWADNCPALANYDQLDQDGDTVGDVCDLDLDGDGINDKAARGDHSAILDNCPRIANEDQRDSDGDGRGDVCDTPGAAATQPGIGGHATTGGTQTIQTRGGISAMPLVYGAAGLVAVAGGVMLWRWVRRLSPAGLLGFSRLRESELLEHPTRAALLQAIQANPGIHYQALLRKLSVSRGVLEHHLHILEKSRLVTPHRWKGTLGYFPYPGPSAATRNATAAMRSPLARRIHSVLQQQPGYTVAEIAAALEVPYAAVAYHVRRFRDAGLVRAMDAGGMSHLYAEDLANPTAGGVEA